VSIQLQKKRLEIHNYDQRIETMLRNIQQELTPKNSQLIFNYNREMINDSLAKATRRKHLEVLFRILFVDF